MPKGKVKGPKQIYVVLTAEGEVGATCLKKDDAKDFAEEGDVVVAYVKKEGGK